MSYCVRSRRLLATYIVAALMLFAVPTLAQTVLLGDQSIEAQNDSNALGTAEAFQTTATASGSLVSLSVYVNSTSTAGQIYAGIYTDNGGNPGTLLTQGSITSITAGSWNTISVPTANVTSGTAYWIAILGTTSGTIRFLDRNGGCTSEASAQTNLTSLPATWSPGTKYSDCPLSAYGTSGTVTTPVLNVTPNTLSFSAVQGGANPASQNISITNTGSGSLSYSITSDAAWLTATPVTGSAPQTVQVSVNISGLAANTYTGHLTITAAGAQGSPATVTVTLNLTAPAPATLVVSPTSVNFSATQNGGNPSPIGVSVTNSGSGTLSYTATSDAAWLVISSTSGNAPDTIQMQPDITGLAANTYVGHVTVTATGAQGSPATVTVTLTVNPPPPPPAPSAPGDWLMINHDPGRSGFAPDEGALSPSNVGNLKLRWSLTVDGQVSTQPLYAGSVTVGSAVHDVIVIGTAGNSLYGIDADSGDVLWQRNFGPQTTTCAFAGPFGIFGAPVIDRATLRVYAVSSDGVLRTVSLVDGTDAAPGLGLITNPDTNKVWGGLNRLGNKLFIATGSDGCDTPPWQGTLFQVDISGPSPVLSNSFIVVPGISGTNSGGGIWSYGGVSIDSGTGNIFLTSGADSSEAFTPWADREIALDPNLNVLGSYLPSQPGSFPCGGAPCDLDFASTPTLFQPNGCSLMTAAGNKDGNLYVFKASDLIANAPPLQVLQLSTANDSLGSGGVGGTAAWWQQGNMLFLTDTGGANGIAGGVVALRPTNACTLQVAWSVPLGSGGMPNSDVVLANGLVFAASGNGGQVHAYDATNGLELWNSGTQNGAYTFGAPTVARGKLYFGSWNAFGGGAAGSVYAFAPDPFPGPVLGGDQTIEPTLDYNLSGIAEAFQVTPASSGKAAAVAVYLDPSSTATQMYAGLYSDANGHPGTLLTQASVNAPGSGRWATVTFPTADLTAGTPYWIAILGTGSGTLEFRDRATGSCSAENSAQNGLTSLPSAWSTGPVSTNCPVSAYIVGLAPSQASLSVVPNPLNLSAPQGTQAVGNLSVSNVGAGTLAFSVATDSPWLSATPVSGTAPQSVQITADSSSLAQGNYTGHVTVTAGGALNSPTSVPVNFTVQSPTPADPVLSVSPGTLSFSGDQGGANPLPQSVSVTNTGTGTLSFTAASDASWLSVAPTSGTAPQSLQVSASLAGLSAGTYTGHITVTGATGVQNSPATVTVTLTVTAPPPPSLLLFGDTAIEAQRDGDALGTAEAFRTTAVASGPVSAMFLYLDPASTVSTLTLGVYTDNGGHPGTLLTQASSTSLTAGTWNLITVPSANITSGSNYWIAVLGTGTGTLYFRDHAQGSCHSEGSSQKNLTTLPSTWTTGAVYSDCPVSGYGKTSP